MAYSQAAATGHGGLYGCNAGPALLHHRLDGDSPGAETVLLLNGIMMSIASWEAVVALLAPHYRVLRCDLRGQLLSPGEPPQRVAGHTADLVQLLDELAIDSAHVIGTSFGGIVGGYLAARYPRRVRSYCSIASSDRFDGDMYREVERWRGSCRAVLEGGDRGRLADIIEPVVFSAAWLQANRRQQGLRRKFFASLDDTWYRGLHGLLLSARTVDLGPELGRIGCPTLIIAAGEDGFIPLSRCRALAEHIPGARFTVIDGAGHAVVSEQPDKVAELCLQHLRLALPTS